RASRNIIGAIVNSLTEAIRLAAELVLGAGIGFMGGLFGISAGAMAITALGLMGFSQQVEQGTSLVMQVPNVAIALTQYAKRGSLDRKNGIAIAAGAL